MHKSWCRLAHSFTVLPRRADDSVTKKGTEVPPLLPVFAARLYCPHHAALRLGVLHQTVPLLAIFSSPWFATIAVHVLHQ